MFIIARVKEMIPWRWHSPGGATSRHMSGGWMTWQTVGIWDGDWSYSKMRFFESFEFWKGMARSLL